MTKPINIQLSINNIPKHGRFGAIRRFDVHTGTDIYCPDNESVYAVEDGIVTDICHFTGKEVDMPWWEDTMAIAIEGKYGVILYGEIYPPSLKVGEKVVAGQEIAKIKRVLKNDKGLPMSMLHIELYKHGYRGDWSVWELDGDKPVDLLNVEDILFNIYGKENLI